MNKYDEELLYTARFEIELEELGEITVSSLSEYQEFIESNFEVGDITSKYVLQEPFSLAFDTRDEAKVLATVANIKELEPLLVDVSDEVIIGIMQGAMRAFDKIGDNFELLKEVTTDNKYLAISIERLLLLNALAGKDIVGIKNHSAKLKIAWQEQEEIANGIEWTVRDFNV